ncbi:MAG: hypothetical protein AB7G11_08890 [Phycisphaerales bacterium]
MHNERNESVKADGAPHQSGAAGGAAGGPDPLGALNQLESHFGAIKKMHAEVAEREARLTEQLAELAQRREELDRQVATVNQDREALANERDSLRRAQEDIVEKLRVIDDARRDLDARAGQLSQEREQAQRDRAAAVQLSQELEEREQRVQADLLQIEAREQTMAAQARKLEAEQTAREAVVREKEIAVAQREKFAGKDADQLRKEVAELKTRLAAGGDQAESARQRTQQLADELEQLRSDSESRLGDVQSRLAEATAAIASRDAQIAHLGGELESVRAALARAESEREQARKNPGHSTPDLSKYETAIKLLNERLKKAEAEKKSLAEQLGKALDAVEERGNGVSGDEMSARARVRRERLRRYKGLLQGQTRKIAQAQAALAKRQAEAEQVLAQRSRIVAALASLQRREAEVAKQKSKSATASLMFYAVAGLAVLLALSWGIAYQVAPATFAARSTIKGDGQGRLPSAGELVAWQQYVQSLAQDPQIIEQTAERLDRRGIKELASGGTLRAELGSALYSDISAPGTVLFEIRGENASRTEIVLDTLISTIVSAANSTRSQRPDGISADVAVPASIGGGPVADQRLVYTGSIFGASAVLFLGMGTFVGRRLGRLKESANAVDTLDDSFTDENDAPDA